MTLLSKEDAKYYCDLHGITPSSELRVHIDAQAAEIERLRKGKRHPIHRDVLGRCVREAWVRWAAQQESPKASWLIPYDQLAESDKEADRQIGEAVYLLAQIGINASDSLEIELLQRRLAESEAAVRVLSDLLRQCEKYVAFCSNLGQETGHLTARELAGKIKSLPSSAAANAESHRRMREACEAIAKASPKRHFVTEEIVETSEEFLNRLQRIAQDALNPAVASAGKLHEELQGEKCP